MGWLEKFGRFRAKKRHYIWDGVRRQLREYKTKDDEHHYINIHLIKIHNYGIKKYNCILMITFFEIQGQSTNTLILKLKASSSRERDSWIRVLNNDNDNNSNDNMDDENELIDDNNNNNNNVDRNYEEYRHLRMTNRLKWSSLFKSLKSTSSYIQNFREFITKQSKLQKCHKRKLKEN